jgi:DNA-binding CsgD family transcriptional regulator
MNGLLQVKTKLPWGLFLLIAAQIVCAVFFGTDVASDFLTSGNEARTSAEQWHLAIESMATLSLSAAIVFEARYILKLLQRKAQLERNVSIASAAMHQVIEAFLDEWSLTASEREVANLLIKGLTISEIANIRGNAEGTVKAHLNAIYRKSGTRNRGDLLSLIIDQLIDGSAPSASPAMAAATS